MKDKKNARYNETQNNRTQSNEIISLIIIGAALLILGIWYFSGFNANPQNTSAQTNETGKYILNSTSGNQTVEAQEAAPAAREQDACATSQVYFIYADWCSHCQKMKPWVEQLISEGYAFIKVNSQDSTAVNEARTCLDGIAQLQYIPEFVCVGNKQDHVGEFASINEMKAFVSACNAIQ